MLRRMSGDPERDPKARPTAPAGVLGGPGKRPEATPAETGRVPKSAFAHTIAMPTAAPAARVPPQRPETMNIPESTGDAEPLREPSARPAPAPYKRANNAFGATLQMPEAHPPVGARSEERMITVKPIEQVGNREPTTRMQTTVSVPPAPPPSNRPNAIPAAPPPSGAPPAMPAQAVASRSPAAPSASPLPKRDDPSVPRLSLGVEKVPSLGPAAPKVDTTAVSQPLQLSLSASDHVETSLRPEARAPSRSLTPWILIAVVLVVGGVAFAMLRGGDKPAAVAPERVEAVPAADPGTATPTPTTEPAQAVAPAVPSTPTAPPKVAPAAPEAAKPVEQAKAQPDAKAAQDEPEPKASSSKKRAHRTKKPAAASGPVLKVSPSGDESDLDKALKAAERMAEPDEDAPPEPAEPPSPD